MIVYSWEGAESSKDCLYGTLNEELSKELAYYKYTKDEKYLYVYDMDTEGLNILDFSKIDSMHWLAEVLSKKRFNIDGREAFYDLIQEVIEEYKLETSKYDIIIGYRTDGFFFGSLIDFISGQIYKDQFESILKDKENNIQICINSKKAFNRMTLICKPQLIGKEYAVKYKLSNTKIRKSKSISKSIIYNCIGRKRHE